jgi:crotonobetainyl-CoA:carnitine CoA-transferase CaiB-like acyl-CoA transferase
MQAFLENGNVCADVVETTQEALRHPQIVEAEYLVELEDPRVGRVVQIGPLAKIPGAPASVRRPAPVPREHTEQVLESETPPPAFKPRQGASLATPLEGVTIIETAYFAALPLGLALLTDLGARVIKIEPVTGDPYRKIGAPPPGVDPIRGLGHNNMTRAMQGKESIAINLKDPRGQQIVHQLVARADAFAHNFRPGVPESLRIDYETLRTIRPGIVYQYGASYGSVGPYSGQPAIDNVITAFSGHMAYQSGEGNPPLADYGADPIAAAGAATSMMLGIIARDRSGESQYVESAMIASNLIANCEDALSYEGKPPRPAVDALQYGTGATHRLYEAAPGDRPRWVFLAAIEDDEFGRFCGVAGCEGLVRDPRFAAVDDRRQNRAALEALLEPVFRSRSAEEWELSLLAAGVGCVRADGMSNLAFLYKDPQALAINMMTLTEHPSFGGRYWRHAPLIGFSETPGSAGPVCVAGEHTRAILAELGYGDSEAAELRAANVVAWPADESEALASART